MYAADTAISIGYAENWKGIARLVLANSSFVSVSIAF